MTQLELPLSLAEKDLLAECEVVIERGIGVFIETGEALMTVRDNRLYRAEFATFEDYAERRWSLSARHVNRLIDSARVIELISGPIGPEINSGVIPATESQARELAPLLDDPDELREVWHEAVERTEGKPTAAAIKAVREERERESEPKPPVREWSAAELQMRSCVETGVTVIASLRGQHQNLLAWAEESGLYVRIDRRTEWGNPFEMPADGDRDTVIKNYALYYLPNKPSLLAKVDDLRGKVLGCWCAPEACHGDVLKEVTEQ